MIICPHCKKELPNHIFNNKYCSKCDKLMITAFDGGYHCENCYGKLK